LKASKKPKNDTNWVRFAGLASQWAIALTILLFLGATIDKKCASYYAIPIFVWVLPFIFIIISLINIIKQTKV
jgi:TctA family transporter